MKKNKSGLSAWELTMMALGTVIGGSFFLGSSIGIRAAGPSIIISYILGGLLVYIILFALSEMTVAGAATGSFRTFAEREFGPYVGFVTGWVYWTGLILAMSSEATAASILLRLWFPNLSLGVMGAIIIIFITMANLLGAERLSKLESGLAAIKIFAVAGFIIMGFLIIAGLLPGKSAIGLGAVRNEPFFQGGISGIAGSMLIVIFSYAGFEVIGLAAAETAEPHKTVPKAIMYTVVALLTLYILAIAVLLPLIPAGELTGEGSPMVEALERAGISWAAFAVNIVLLSAIFSTMLAATFGLGRMIRSLADEGHAPVWLKDRGEIPYKGILFSGAAMLAGLSLGFILPDYVYVFLVSSGGFSLLFTYLVIAATHYKFRRGRGCPPSGKCQLIGYPYTAWLSIVFLIVIILSMPLISGQASGLIAGIALILFYSAYYLFRKSRLRKN